jgi:hypothetical protein
MRIAVPRSTPNTIRMALNTPAIDAHGFGRSVRACVESLSRLRDRTHQ